MLYVSRLVDAADYGVVDSEDNTEEVVDYEALLAAYRSGLTIEGITLDREATLHAGQIHLARVDVWEGLRVKSQLAIKLYMLRGIDIRVYKRWISSIRWNPEKIDTPVELRLSDFGRVCGDRMLFGVVDGAIEGRHTITFVLDDKVRVARNAFSFPFFVYSGIGGTGVKFDIREVTDTRTLSAIYTSLRSYPDSFRAKMNCPIIDKPDRLAVWGRPFFM